MYLSAYQLHNLQLSLFICQPFNMQLNLTQCQLETIDYNLNKLLLVLSLMFYCITT